MGLAATRTKQRFGLDPRNTAWSNDTSRFGHQQLEKFGWKPGMGLGMKPLHSHTSHIKVHIKDDNVGLGAKIKRQERKDEFDNGECAGLDVFQRILGRLNGKEQEISDELETQRKEKILNGKWGVHFVKGEVLSSTWDPKTKKLKSYANMEKKRSRSDDEDDNESSESSESSDSDIKPKKKKSKKDKKGKKEKKSKKHKEEKKEKKHKKDRKHKDKKEKKEKKEKKKAAKLESRKAPAHVPHSVTTRLSVRSRWIKQKKAATMDVKALNEIFMVTEN
ncbi:protein Pxr1p [Monosporozyma unispora]|nr:telomerase inhibitor [Kazachstania unispora]